MIRRSQIVVVGLVVSLCLGGLPNAVVAQGKKKSPQNKTKEFLEAQKKSAVPKARKDAHSIYRSAVILLQEGWEDGNVDYAEVEKRLRASIAKDPTYSRPYLFLGKVFEDRWQWNKAINAYREATRKTVDKEDGFISLARVYARTGKTNDANKVLNSVLKLNPKNADAKTVKASMMRKDGDLDGAKKLLREALGHSPEAVETYKELALVYYEKKSYKYARLALLKAIKLKENDPSIYNTMGLIALKEGERDKAIAAFRKAVEVDDQFFPPHMNLSSMYLERGYFARALSSLDTAKRLQPGNPAVSSSLGVAYRGLGDYKKAEENFKNALALDKGYKPALYNLGILNFRHLNKPDEAKKYFAEYRARGGSEAPSSKAVPILRRWSILSSALLPERRRLLA